MSVNKINIKDKFFLENGKRIYEVKEVAKGDVIGMITPKESCVHLNYVNEVHLNPTLFKLDFFPYARLRGTNFFFNVSDELKPVGYMGFHLNQEKSTGRIWEPKTISKHLSSKIQRAQRDYIDNDFFEELGDNYEEDMVYIINEGIYKDLGNLIPLLDLPSFSFLPQSRDIGELVKMVRGSEEKINLLKKTHLELKEIFNKRY